jgi:preprotein translocase subunit SecE
MGAFFHELFHLGLYKRTQGRITRRVTCVFLAGTFVIAAWQLTKWLDVGYQSGAVVYGIPLVLVIFGIWASYRIVNLPRFADFLIAVEAEMNKVSWPSRTELVRSSLVVIFVIFFLAFVLYGFDFLWRGLFKFLHILE